MIFTTLAAMAFVAACILQVIVGATPFVMACCNVGMLTVVLAGTWLDIRFSAASELSKRMIP